MNAVSPTNSALHHAIIRHFLDHGAAPSVDELSSRFGVTRQSMLNALRALQEYHGVVLHPVSGEIWAIHPFSAAPTNFWVRSRRGAWWGNCAWCSLGIAALLRDETSITTVLGGESQQIEIRIENDAVVNGNFLVHFPIAMARAWDNVAYTCSNMLVFDSSSAIDDWCRRHRMPRGDVQPLSNIWEFAKVWYGRHLDEDWTKWTAAEARGIFARFNLTGPIWEIADVSERF